jgi:hypothetical protein
VIIYRGGGIEGWRQSAMVGGVGLAFFGWRISFRKSIALTERTPRAPSGNPRRHSRVLRMS